jgi:MFS family permease
MRREEKILLRASNIWYLGAGMFGPLLAVFTEQIGGDVLDVSWAWAIFLVVSGCLHILFGRLADDLDRATKLMVWGYVLNAFFTFAYLFVHSPLLLFVVQAGLGLALAMATPTWNALYDRYGDRRHLGTEWGLADGEAQVIMGVAMLIGGAIVAYGSFDLLFIVMGLIQVVATVVQAGILRNGKAG